MNLIRRLFRREPSRATLWHYLSLLDILLNREETSQDSREVLRELAEELGFRVTFTQSRRDG